MDTSSKSAVSSNPESAAPILPGQSPGHLRRPMLGAPAWLLLFLAPAMAELLSTSAPPVEYFQPLAIIMMHATYGATAVLLREYAVRLRLGAWGRAVLALFMGFYIEGLFCKSYFCLGWPDFNVPEGYGRLLGINWPWFISLEAYHALFSFLLPLLIVDLVWPQLRNRPALNRGGIILLSIVSAASGILAFVFMPTDLASGTVYHPGLGITLLLALALVGIPWLARRVSEPALGTHRPPSPRRLAWLVFAGWVVFQVLISWICAEDLGLPALHVVALQLTVLSVVLLVARAYSQRLTVRHQYALVMGSVAFLVGLSLLRSLPGGDWPDDPTGSWVVGLIALVFCFLLGRRIRKRESSPALD